jgi:hypothetical protein
MLCIETTWLCIGGGYTYIIKYFYESVLIVQEKKDKSPIHPKHWAKWNILIQIRAQRK